MRCKKYPSYDIFLFYPTRSKKYRKLLQMLEWKDLESVDAPENEPPKSQF